MHETCFAFVRVLRTKSSGYSVPVFISLLPSTNLYLTAVRGITAPTLTHPWFPIHAKSTALIRAYDLDQLITLASAS